MHKQGWNESAGTDEEHEPAGTCPDERGNPEPPCCVGCDVMVVAAMTVE